MSNDRYANELDRLGHPDDEEDAVQACIHTCMVCFTPSDIHPGECYQPECADEVHWPPLCCPGCPCLSFEEAHPEVAREEWKRE